MRPALAKLRNSAPAILSLAVLAGGVWLWSDKLDVAAIVNKLAGANPVPAIFSLVCALAFSPLNACRLGYITRLIAGLKLPYWGLLRVTCIGQFVTATAPMGLIGDAAKVALMRPLGALSWLDSLLCVLSDRASGAIFITCLGIVLLPVRLAAGAPLSTLVLEACVFLGILVGIAAVLRGGPTLQRLGWRGWGVPAAMLRAIGSLFEERRRIWAQLALALANFALTLAATYLLARSMSINISPFALGQYLPLIMIVSSLPFLYLGWGGRELVMVTTVGTLPGVSTNDALSLSIAIGSLWIVAALPNGLFLLTGWRRKPQT